MHEQAITESAFSEDLQESASVTLVGNIENLPARATMKNSMRAAPIRKTVISIEYNEPAQKASPAPTLPLINPFGSLTDSTAVKEPSTFNQKPFSGQ